MGAVFIPICPGWMKTKLQMKVPEKEVDEQTEGAVVEEEAREVGNEMEGDVVEEAAREVGKETEGEVVEEATRDVDKENEGEVVEEAAREVDELTVRELGVGSYMAVAYGCRWYLSKILKVEVGP